MPTGNHFTEIEAQLASSSHHDEFHQHLDLKMNQFQTATHDTVYRLHMDTEREMQSIFEHFSNRIQEAEQMAREKFNDFEHFLAERSNY